jgi:hypothetical protein
MPMKKVIFSLLITFAAAFANAQSMTFGDVYNWQINDVICYSQTGTYGPPIYTSYHITGKQYNADSTTVTYQANKHVLIPPSGPNDTSEYYSSNIEINYIALKTNIYAGVSGGFIQTIDFNYNTTDTIISYTNSNFMPGIRKENFYTAGCGLEFEPCNWNGEYIEGVGGFGDYTFAAENFIDRQEFQYAIKNNGQDTIGFYFDITSINNQLINNSINVYPSPANDYIYVDCHNNENNLMAYIYNTSGQIIKSAGNIRPKEPIFLTGIPAGTYLLAIETKNKFVYHKLFIKTDN